MIPDRNHGLLPFPLGRWLLLVPVVFCAGMGCIDFDQELTRICERHQDNPLCGGTVPPPESPEFVSANQALWLPEGGLFNFSVEARYPQGSALHFTWEASSGAFSSPQVDTPTSSEVF